MLRAIDQVFTAHPATVGESYTEHGRFAFSFGWRLMKASLAAMIHGVLPFAFQTTASREVKNLNAMLAERARVHTH